MYTHREVKVIFCHIMLTCTSTTSLLHTLEAPFEKYLHSLQYKS